MAEPRYRLAVLARISSTGITLHGRRNSFVALLTAIAANLTTDRRGMHAQLFSNAGLAFSSGLAALNLITLALSQLPVRLSHLRLNPLV